MRNQATALIFAGTLLSLTQLSHAQTKPVYQQTVAIGGMELITLRGDSEKAVAARADILYSRLVWILADSTLARRDIWIDFSQNDPAIYVKKRLLITVIPPDYQFNQSTAEKQADIWRQRFSETLPLLKSADPPPKK